MGEGTVQLEVWNWIEELVKLGHGHVSVGGPDTDHSIQLCYQKGDQQHCLFIAAAIEDGKPKLRAKRFDGDPTSWADEVNAFLGSAGR